MPRGPRRPPPRGARDRSSPPQLLRAPWLPEHSHHYGKVPLARTVPRPHCKLGGVHGLLGICHSHSHRAQVSIDQQGGVRSSPSICSSHYLIREIRRQRPLHILPSLPHHLHPLSSPTFRQLRDVTAPNTLLAPAQCFRFSSLIGEDVASRAFQTSAATCPVIGGLVPGMGGIERLEETLERKTFRIRHVFPVH